MFLVFFSNYELCMVLVLLLYYWHIMTGIKYSSWHLSLLTWLECESIVGLLSDTYLRRVLLDTMRVGLLHRRNNSKLLAFPSLRLLILGLAGVLAISTAFSPCRNGRHARWRSSSFIMSPWCSIGLWSTRRSCQISFFKFQSTCNFGPIYCSRCRVFLLMGHTMLSH